jgi:7-carboxy-7-deazaguanine synthase (Cx14CxxC type)
MSYTVKEVYYTLQGEGAHTGRAAVFCRFAGCNLWSGREQDRATAICRFCDTDFIGSNGPGGGKFADPDVLADHLLNCWESEAQGGSPYVVFTGGEPLLQLDIPLIQACHARHLEIAIESNGTLVAPPGIDWICISPKGRAPLKQRQGNEIKLVYPQSDCAPEDFENLHFEQFYLQPMDGPAQQANTQAAIAYCRQHPRWRLSLQTHKLIGIP